MQMRIIYVHVHVYLYIKKGVQTYLHIIVINITIKHIAYIHVFLRGPWQYLPAKKTSGCLCNNSVLLVGSGLIALQVVEGVGTPPEAVGGFIKPFESICQIGSSQKGRGTN